MTPRSAFATDYNAHTFASPLGAGPDSADRKAPPAHLLYPELKDYARVDPERYWSHAFMAQEQDKLWSRAWLCAGRVSDIPGKGDWLRHDVGRESVIVARGRDGIIRAMHNVCQHRGRQLVDGDFGSTASFVCPFHSWVYDLTGRNARVTDRETFSDHALCGDLSLRPVRCDTWGGFVFITMDADAPSLLDYLGPIPELTAAYRMEDMHVILDTMIPIDCNWKAGMEAFLETYHVHMTHPQTLPGVDEVNDQIDIFANGHGRIATPFATPSPRLGASVTMNPFLAAFLSSAGLNPDSFNDNLDGIREAIHKAKLSPDNPFGLDYSAFTRSQAIDTWAYSIFPNLTLNCHPEGVLVMRFLPHPTDPEKFTFNALQLGAKLREGVPFPFYMGIPEGTDTSGQIRPKRRQATMSDHGHGLIIDQDISNLCSVQKGVRSRGFAGGNRYSETEMRIQVLHAELDRYLAR